MKKIIVICGPTGIGKTTFAIALAGTFNGEVVGADSMQIYKHMNIGTAKPSKEELDQVRHHLVDCVDPKTEYDAGQYIRDAGAAIQDILSRKKLPIVAGGTGLYIRALLHGLFRSDPICEKTMEKLSSDLETDGPGELHDRLKLCDPEAAFKIHPNDAFRVIRALEIFLATGKKISDLQTQHNFNANRYRAFKIGLSIDRQELYDRINQRVEIMVANGLLMEVKALLKKGYSFDLKPMKAIGYYHMALFIQGDISWDEAIRLLKRDTRRYAKRQFTWFNKDKEIHWLHPGQINKAKVWVKDFLT